MNSKSSINASSAGNDFSFKSNKEFYLYSAALLGLWIIFCWQGLVSAVQIWYGNEIFNHGFFIVPGAIYLIYLKRKVLLSNQFQTSALALVVIVPALLLYVIGIAGDVQLFMHIATFTLLPALIWLMLGTKAAKTILFPLVFMLFSIPVGEQLTPYLQEIAADGSVALLRLTGIPLFRSGLFIEIPQGRFLVAEACSGVSFFIASFVIGSLYAYLNLVSVKRRIAFVSIALIFPVLANVIRVYGIILIAYWTDMEYAAGADHLIYGWFFFAFVILCLLGIGELMRDCSINQKVMSCGMANNAVIHKGALLVVSCILGSSTFWVNSLHQNSDQLSQQNQPIFDHILKEHRCIPSNEWGPEIQNPSSIIEQGIYLNGTCSVVIQAWFLGVDNELVSSLHRWFSPTMWSLKSVSQIKVSNSYNAPIEVLKIVSPKGSERYITALYFINEKLFDSGIKAKLYQIYLALVGQPLSGSLVIISSENEITHESVYELLFSQNDMNDY